MRLFSRFLLVTVFATGVAANADFLIEPYAGYAIGSFKPTVGGAAGTEEDTKGIFYGARAGYALPLGLAFGAEFMMGALKDEDLAGADEASKINWADPGVFVSFDFPVLVRAFATYFPTSKLKVKDSTGTTTLEGNQIKLGVGLTWLPFLSINLEYMLGKHDTTISGIKVETESSGYGLSVSCPIEF